MFKSIVDTISLTVSPSSSDVKLKPQRRTLIFFITGNPGLIEYYRVFLHRLHELLKDSTDTGRAFEIYGASLPGFEVETESAAKRRREVGIEHVPPYALNEVIGAVECDLWRKVKALRRNDDSDIDVIVMGHSVGAYIGLEIIQRHRERLEAGGTEEAHVTSGICLFPTVVDIGKSERGKVLTALSRVPYFPQLISLLASILLFLLPTTLLQFITSTVTNPEAGPVTAAFLASPSGVRQALFMGGDEMRQITKDKWDDELWGAAHPAKSGVTRPRLFFLFGENDHWVAETTKEELMRVRGTTIEGEKWRPRMEVDETGVPHGFCISHSLPVAEKASKYIADICQSSG